MRLSGLVQDAIFSRPPGLNKTGIFFGGRDPHIAIEMLNICKGSLVEPFTLSAFADPRVLLQLLLEWLQKLKML
ncbi:MAG: hypothetical protein CM15mP93_08820 [Thiotrichaceae bacterium]|nr:MAG: hypothetical protein CM15mP93_08820 [Thiotrichaceae bacterium]